jgi:hypothetical protein
MSWWEIEEGFPLQALDWYVSPEDDFEKQVWICGVCQALITRPVAHVAWHKEK